MRLPVALFTALLLAVGLVAAACGDGPDEPATPTVSSGEWGPEPRMGRNVTRITPPHKGSLTQRETGPGMPDAEAGLCFEVNFEGFDSGNLQWFQLAIDGERRTLDILWIPQRNNEGAVGCFRPKTEPLAEGRHQVAVAVQNPANPGEPAREVVSWEFDVTS